MKSTLRPALVLFGALTLLVGVLYPLAVTGIGKLAFSDQVSGSLVLRDGKPIGSSLIGQSFTAPGYFWSRPSATAPMSNNAGGSSGANQGPLNPAFTDAVKGRIAALREADPQNQAAIPVDLSPPRPAASIPTSAWRPRATRPAAWPPPASCRASRSTA